jgi:hypothetical protein
VNFLALSAAFVNKSSNFIQVLSFALLALAQGKHLGLLCKPNRVSFCLGFAHSRFFWVYSVLLSNELAAVLGPKSPAELLALRASTVAVGNSRASA